MSSTNLLFDAIKNKDLVQVKRCLADGVDPNSIDEESRSALYVAVDSGDKDIVNALIQEDADIEIGQYDVTPLMVAVNKNDASVSIVKLLLDKKANPNALGVLRNTPLILAVPWGKASIVKLLLDAGANPDARNQNGRTPLNWARDKKHQEIIDMLLKVCKNPRSLQDEL